MTEAERGEFVSALAQMADSVERILTDRIEAILPSMVNYEVRKQMHMDAESGVRDAVRDAVREQVQVVVSVKEAK